MRPAQGAVAGIEIQISDFAAANHWQVGRRGRAQAGPILGAAGVCCPGKKLLHTPHNRLATHQIELTVITSKLCGPGNAQAVFNTAIRSRGGVAAENQFEFIVGQRGFVSMRLVHNWQRH